jgi:selenocysteine-specific elongation factor
MHRGVIVGTAGHVDHGKTSLVRALTGVETDRWAEERDRGLTIDIGFAPMEAIAGGDAGIVDVPGHEDFVKNMLAGSTGVDVLLLVVAADEGPMPQTREHLTIARLLGIQAGVIALNKVDRVDDEWLALVRDATREEVSRILGHAGWPLVPVSAVTGQGLTELREAIGVAASGCAARDAADLFRMPVDRSFSVKGAGTVVTGTTWSGTVMVGEKVRVLPQDVTARVRSLQVHGEERTGVGPARRCAMALVGIDASHVDRGSVVLGKGNWKSVSRVGARIEVPPGSTRDIEHGQRIRLYLGTAEVMARVRTTNRGGLSSGGTGWVVLDCERPVVARVGDRFVLRFYSPVTTVGGGQVCSLDPPRGWREQVGSWAAVLDGSPEDSVRAAVDLAGGRGLAVDDLPLVTRISAGSTDVLLDGIPTLSQIGASFYGGKWVERASAAVLGHLGDAHQRRKRASTESLESVRAGLSGRFSPELIDRVVEALAGTGEVVVDGPGIRLTSHAADLSEDEEGAMRRLVDTLSEAELAPPSPAELATLIGVARDVLNDLLRLLIERGEVIRVTPEIFVTRAAEARARATIRKIADAGAVTPGEFRTALGLTRKHLIPLLEHMDRVGVTRRTTEGRVLSDNAGEGRGAGGQST